MKKVLIIILIGLISSCELVAQEYKKNWSEGALTWNDFIERRNSQGVSELKYFLGYHARKQKFGDTTVVRNMAEAYIDRESSWINPEYKTEQFLRYNQVIFDIVEIYKRRLQLELDGASSIFDTESKLYATYAYCTNEIEQFQLESADGFNLEAIEFWEQIVSNELNRYTEKSIPEFKNRSFGYGLHAGIGAGTFSGSIADHFSPTFNFMFGFDFAYKRSIFYLNGTLAGGKVRKDYLSNDYWYEDQNFGLAVIDISYGYAFLDNKKFKLAPFAGLGITELSATNKNDKENGLRLVDYNVIFGLNADYKLRKKINLTSAIKEKVETSIRARLYVTRANFDPNLKGYSINLTVGICGFGNMIRLQ
ncbi:hypothetical protein M2137_001269 [Parabacteroides sp. PFB2-10]|uniref:hypothetical protein n=1 Tax=Parabacteroides sp. PFB2-10 TaxID=1742405 RepID=UPI00247335A7|nr:hypothetical protein [Parabacteroides sp. PFB2-10]MDH6312498.1 hypothetical protein [Parabacteroides sp. PFB2-10]MDL2244412.1 hypothetical protein [Parabacteroides sp. OttesenSCG-928-J18]